MMHRADGPQLHPNMHSSTWACPRFRGGGLLCLVLACFVLAPAASSAKESGLTKLDGQLNLIAQGVASLSQNYLSRAVRERENRFAARMNEGQFFYYAKAYDRAAMVLLNLVTQPKHRTKAGYRDAVFFLAESLYQLRNYKTCIQYFDLLLSIGNNEQKQHALGRLLALAIEMENGALGRKYVGRAVRSAGANASPDLHYALGKYRYRTNDLPASLTHFNQVAKGSAAYLKAQYFGGVILLRQGKNEPANTAFMGIYAHKSTGQTNADDNLVKEQALLALARLAYERSDFDLAIDLYNRVSRDSALFDSAMYELVWIAIKQKDYDKALQKLELLLISQPDVLLGPDARVLQGKLKLMIKAYEAAEKTFDFVSQKFGAIQKEMETVRKQHPNLAGHFDTVIGDRIVEFDMTSVLPPKAAKIAGDKVAKGADMRLVADVAAERRDMTEAKRAIEQLQEALQSENRVEMFPQIHMGVLKSIEYRTKLTRIRAEVNEYVGSRLTSQPADYRRLRDERRARGRALTSVPRSVSRMKERDKRIDDRMSDLDQAAHRLTVDLRGIESQLVAIGKYLRDTKTDPGAAPARRTLKKELAEAKEVKAQIEELVQRIDNERLSVGVNDDASRTDDRIYRQYQIAVRRESRWLIQRGANTGRTLRDRADALERKLDGFVRESDKLVAEQVREYRKLVQQEQERVGRYFGELSQQENAVRSLGGAIAARTFLSVLKRISSIVLEADVGLVDASWKRKDDKSKEIGRVLNRQGEELKRLQRLFSEVTGE